MGLADEDNCEGTGAPEATPTHHLPPKELEMAREEGAAGGRRELSGRCLLPQADSRWGGVHMAPGKHSEQHLLRLPGPAGPPSPAAGRPHP